MGVKIFIVGAGDGLPTKKELERFRELCDEFTQEDGLSISEAMYEAARIVKEERGKPDENS